MKIILATSNKHKVREFQHLFPAHELLLPDSLGLDFNVEETGSSFLENALLKARFVHANAKGLPVMADDSGICVPALNGAPGIYSNRYGSQPGGIPLEAERRNKLLLDETSSFHGNERQAYFVCCLIILLREEKIYSVQETLWGEISASPAGINGFGYDPVFYLPEYRATVAELDSEKKNAISHRARAAKKMALLLE